MDLFKSVAHYLKNTDLYLAVIAFICSGYGMALIYSATLNPVSIKDDGSTKNLYVQGAAILIGFGAFVLMSLIDLEGLRNRWKNFVIVNICLQLLLFTPLGMEVNGQRAWLNLGVTSLQPGELGKLIFIFTMAAHISEVGEYISELRGLAAVRGRSVAQMDRARRRRRGGERAGAVEFCAEEISDHANTRAVRPIDRPAGRASDDLRQDRHRLGTAHRTGIDARHHDAAPVRPGEPDRLYLFGRR